MRIDHLISPSTCAIAMYVFWALVPWRYSTKPQNPALAGARYGSLAGAAPLTMGAV